MEKSLETQIMDKKIIKNLFVSLAVIFVGMSAMASPDRIVKNAVKKADISKTALISVSFKEIGSDKTVVDYNSKLPMSVASVQKIVTTIPALDKLGGEYKFETKLFKKNKDLYIKLGADPYLTSRTLRYMVKDLGNYKISVLDNVYIDDSITDRIEWGEGWQWDNTLNNFMPKFGAYNIDNNRLDVVIRPTKADALAEIYTTEFYPIVFKNEVLTGNVTKLSFNSRDYMQPDVIEVSGTVCVKTEKKIPINDLRKYFILRLKDSFKKNKISYYGKFQRASVPSDAVLVAKSESNVNRVVSDIMQNSDNMKSETLFKVAGGGSTNSAIEMFKNYYQSRNIDIDGVKITDASGVSKNNLLNANFITDVLVNDYNNPNSIKNYMAVPGVGTLQNRMFYLKDRLNAKTGTLQNVSAIAGYLTAESGKEYAFCIIINDGKSSDFDKKSFEEYVIRTVYEAL